MPAGRHAALGLVTAPLRQCCKWRSSSIRHLPRTLACFPAQVRHLVDVLLQLVDSLGGDPDADVRQFTAQASARLQALAEEAQGGGQACAAAQEVGEDGEQAAAEFEEVEQAAAEAAEMQRAW